MAFSCAAVRSPVGAVGSVTGGSGFDAAFGCAVTVTRTVGPGTLLTLVTVTVFVAPGVGAAAVGSR